MTVEEAEMLAAAFGEEGDLPARRLRGPRIIDRWPVAPIDQTQFFAVELREIRIIRGHLNAKGYLLLEFYSGATGVPGRFSEG